MKKFYSLTSLSKIHSVNVSVKKSLAWPFLLGKHQYKRRATVNEVTDKMIKMLILSQNAEFDSPNKVLSI